MNRYVIFLLILISIVTYTNTKVREFIKPSIKINNFKIKISHP